jgi:hypothetical protein
MRHIFYLNKKFVLLFPACDVAGSHGDMKFDMANARIGEVKNLGSGRSSHSSLDNGRILVLKLLYLQYCM